MAEEKKPVQEPEQEANTEAGRGICKGCGKGEKEKEEREDSERGLRPLAGGVRQPQAAAPARACRVR